MNMITRYMQWLYEHDLETYAYPPIGMDVITAFEQAHDIALPAQLRELYLRLGGQEGEVLNQIPYRLIPLSEVPHIQNRLLTQIQQRFGNDWSDFRLDDFEDSSTVQNMLFNERWFPIFQNDNDDYYCLDFAPAAAGRVGQVIALRGELDGKAADILLMFDSFDACLEDIVEDLDGADVQDMESFFAHTGESLDVLGDFLRDGIEVNRRYDAEIAAHIEDTVGDIAAILSGTDERQIDMYHVAADESRPFQLLVTSGMSSVPMLSPAGESWRVELVIVLPPDWDLQAEDITKTWPLQWLDILARLPHEQQAWLGYGHAVTFNEDATAMLPGTNFNALLLLSPRALPEDFLRLETMDGETIVFYALVPIYPAELALLNREGLDALLVRFNESDVSEYVDCSRPDCAAS